MAAGEPYRRPPVMVHIDLPAAAREQTRRSRQADTGVLPLYRAAISVNIADVICSAGSGS